MRTAVVFTKDFRTDLLVHTRRLLADRRADWAERLMGEIESLAALLGRFPESGAVELRRSGREVRRMVLHKLPFVAWYHWRARAKQVVVLRLFHVRQRR